MSHSISDEIHYLFVPHLLYNGGMKQTELELLNRIVQRHGLHVYCECGECRVRHAPLPKLGFVAIAGTNEPEFAQRVLERFVENEREKRMWRFTMPFQELLERYNPEEDLALNDPWVTWANSANASEIKALHELVHSLTKRVAELEKLAGNS